MNTKIAHAILMEVRNDPKATQADKDYAYKKYLRALTVEFAPCWDAAIKAVGTKRS